MYTLSISLEEEMCELLINVLFSKGYVRWIFGLVVKHRENSGMKDALYMTVNDLGPQIWRPGNDTRIGPQIDPRSVSRQKSAS